MSLLGVPSRRELVLGQPAFLPTSLSGLQLWLAADSSPITLAAGMAAQFNSASSRYLTRANNAVLLGATSGWWRGGWYYPDSHAADQVLLSTLSGNTGIEVRYLTANQTLKLSVGNGSAVKTATSVATFTDSTWNQWYVQYDGTNIGVSVGNEALQTTALAAAFSPGAQAFFVGATVTPSLYANGRMQCVALDDGTLSTAQRTTLLNSGVPLSYAQFIAASLPVTSLRYWELNEASGTRADLGTAGDNLTSTNSVGTNPGTCLNAVSQWTDLGSLGNNATQATQALKPYYRSSIINGRPVVRFDGLSQLLSANTLAAIFSGATPPSTVVVVTRFTGAGINLRVWAAASSSSSNPFHDLVTGTGWVGERRSDGNTFKSLTGTTVPSATPIILDYVFDGTNANLIANGATEAGPTSLVGTATVNRFTLGAFVNNGASNWYPGDIAEIIIYNRALSTTEHRAVERYLSNKWGIAVT